VDPLLERGEELAALESVVEAARDGRGQLVLVAGEAGIGKTSLVRALRERLGQRAAFLVGALGIRADPGCLEGSWRRTDGGGVVLYTDGLTEARHGGQLFGLEGATAALEGLDKPSPVQAIDILRDRSSEFAEGILTDDICLLAARIS
jgi:energy-coupling factor transporter ATP-binding protein EcfA2